MTKSAPLPRCQRASHRRTSTPVDRAVSQSLRMVHSAFLLALLARKAVHAAKEGYRLGSACISQAELAGQGGRSSSQVLVAVFGRGRTPQQTPHSAFLQLQQHNSTVALAFCNGCSRSSRLQ
jgi:hypothetical protein